jgi:hypothetical protein
MKKEYGRWLLLSGVLLFYAFLYIATSKIEDGPYACDEECEKIRKVDSLMRNDYPLTYTYKCNTDFICLNLFDSTQSATKGLTDTACMYLKNEGLLNYKINVIGNNGRDTLLKQPCP